MATFDKTPRNQQELQADTENKNLFTDVAKGAGALAAGATAAGSRVQRALTSRPNDAQVQEPAPAPTQALTGFGASRATPEPGSAVTQQPFDQSGAVSQADRSRLATQAGGRPALGQESVFGQYGDTTVYGRTDLNQAEQDEFGQAIFSNVQGGTAGSNFEGGNVSFLNQGLNPVEQQQLQGIEAREAQQAQGQLQGQQGGGIQNRERDPQSMPGGEFMQKAAQLIRQASMPKGPGSRAQKRAILAQAREFMELAKTAQAGIAQNTLSPQQQQQGALAERAAGRADVSQGSALEAQAESTRQTGLANARAQMENAAIQALPPEQRSNALLGRKGGQQNKFALETVPQYNEEGFQIGSSPFSFNKQTGEANPLAQQGQPQRNTEAEARLAKNPETIDEFMKIFGYRPQGY